MQSRRIHERFLRHIWSRQYLRSAELRTADGRPLVVEDPGRLNLDAGPDVLAARVRVGDTLFAGDVEIHRTVADWLAHAHHTDPRYNTVILHVVLERPAPDERTLVHSGREVPLLILGSFLADTLRVVWHDAILDERARRRSAIPCAAENHAVPRSVIEPWLDHMEAERLEVKLRRFEERLRDLALRRLMAVRETPRAWDEPPDEGTPDEIPPPFPELTRRDLSFRGLWDQVLYEGILEGLGYSKNRRPFIRLSQHLTLEFLASCGAEPISVEACLFGVAGLLPDPSSLTDDARQYAAILDADWRKRSPLYHGDRLLATDWVFAPTRPQNGPCLRLAAARAIVLKILREDLFRSVIRTLRDIEEPREQRRRLHVLLEASPGPFWSHHYSFDRIAGRPVNPLGDARKDDIIVNTLLPLGLLYARTFRSKAVREGTLRMLRSFPASSSNVLTELMERQLTRGRVLVDSAGRQQALIQLYKYYCEDERCAECAVGRFLWEK